MNIVEKLLEVRKAVPYLKKEAQGQQYKYVSSSQVLQSLREAMDEQKLLLVPRVMEAKVSTEMVEWQDGNKPKKTTTYFTELLMEFTWVNGEKPDETIVCPWYGQGVDIAGEKGVGKALTYAEKYFLLKFFNVATDKDDPDAQQSPPPPRKEKPLPEQAQEMFGGELTDEDKQNIEAQFANTCSSCGVDVPKGAVAYSNKHFERTLCNKCQKEAK
jgi:hypothetical protein